MKTFCLDLPILYGDHHVIEVRRILLAAPGVHDVYASSAFQVVEVSYDPEKVTEAELTALLEEAGYSGDWKMPMEMGKTAYHTEGEEPFFRHTASYEATRQTVSFAQQVPYLGRPLWACPGMGPIAKVEE